MRDRFRPIIFNHSYSGVLGPVDHGESIIHPPVPSTIETMSYSVEAANAPSIEGETKPHRNPLTRDTDLIKQFDDAVATLYDNFQIAVKKYGT